jgi:hypothetical protein
MTFAVHIALAGLAGATLSAVPAAAQDTPSVDFNGALDHARTTGRMVRQAQQRGHRTTVAGRPTPAQVAACRDKTTYSRQYGADHPKVRRLYQLCHQVGL